MFLTSITVCENCANFWPCIVQFDWLISDQLRYSLNINLNLIALSYAFWSRTAQNNKSTKNYFLFYFLFSFLTPWKMMKLMKTFWIWPQNSCRFFPGDLVLKLRDLEIWWKTWRCLGKPRELAGIYRASDIWRGRGPTKFRYFREIPRNSPKNAKSTRNISKYMSAKHI